MAENIFLARQEPTQLKDYLQFTGGSRGATWAARCR